MKKRKKHVQLLKYTVKGTTDGKATERKFSRLLDARKAGLKLFRLGRFTSLTNDKGVLLPL